MSNRTTKSLTQQILEMLDQGFRISYISRYTGLSRNTIYKIKARRDQDQEQQRGS